MHATKVGPWLTGLAAALLLATPAAAEVITLNDGTTCEGRIVERTDTSVTVQVTVSSGISYNQKIDIKDIRSIAESLREPAQLALEFDKRMSAADDARSAADYTSLGQWAGENRLYDRAALAYQKALAMAPDQEQKLGYAVADNLALAGRLRPAQTMLKALAVKFPGDRSIAARLTQLNEQQQQRVDSLVKLSLDNYRNGQTRSAVAIMERVARLDVDDLATQAGRAMQQQAQMPYARMVAEMRLHQPCATCGTETQLGLVPCPACRGSGKTTERRNETVITKDAKTGVETRRVAPTDVTVPCSACKGFGTVICPGCHGAGMDLGAMGPLERTAVSDGLKKRIDFLYDKLSSYAADPSSLDPVNMEVVYLQTARLRYYMQQYVTLNPELAGEELTTLADRRTNADNLFRHVSAAYRNRDLDGYKAEIARRLEALVEKDLLWPDDFNYRDSSDVSSTATKPAGRP